MTTPSPTAPSPAAPRATPTELPPATVEKLPEPPPPTKPRPARYFVQTWDRKHCCWYDAIVGTRETAERWFTEDETDRFIAYIPGDADAPAETVAGLREKLAAVTKERDALLVEKAERVKTAEGVRIFVGRSGDLWAWRESDPLGRCWSMPSGRDKWEKELFAGCRADDYQKDYHDEPELSASLVAALLAAHPLPEGGAGR